MLSSTGLMTKANMDNLYLLDIDTQGIDRSVCRSLVNQEGAQHVFKVRGESRMVAVVKGNVDEALDNPVGHKVRTVSCTPLILYETFARETLNVLDSEVEKKGKVAPFVKGQDIYWLQFDAGYEGRTLEELLKAWHDEAVVGLGLLHGGQVPVAIYKSVAMRQVHLFMQMDGGTLDKTSFGLPMMKALGDQVKITTKAVRTV